MYDTLFGNQDLVTQSRFREVAEKAGLEPRAFEACMAGHAAADLVATEKAAGFAVEISGTPTLFINGRMLSGSKPYEVLRGTVTEEISRSLGTRDGITGEIGTGSHFN